MELKSFTKNDQRVKDTRAIVFENLNRAYIDVFEQLAKGARGKELPDCTTDCIYQPAYPGSILEALQYIADNEETDNYRKLKFIDLGSGMGNILFLAARIRPSRNSYGIFDVTGIELEQRFVRMAQILGIEINYGDMLRVPFGRYDVVHFFNSLGRAEGKEEKLYARFDAEMKKGSYLVLTSSRWPNEDLWECVYTVDTGITVRVFKRN